ncbi:MAG: PP2C family protein-serine/threonine phosphatase [Vicinamibacterales bacterium]
MELTVDGRTETGHRKTNEDRLAWWSDLGLFVVADGMGGHNAGEVASRLAVDAIHGFIADSATFGDITWPFGYDASCSAELNRLTTAVRLANLRVFGEASRTPELQGMGTTVVAVLITAERVAIASVGDSRAYRWRQGELEQLTRDDTWLNSVLKPEEIGDADRTHPLRHVLTRVVGVGEDVKPSAREEALEPGDTLVMCTDGVHGRLDAATFARVLETTETTADRAARLVGEALAKGTSDNATALVINVR